MNPTKHLMAAVTVIGLTVGSVAAQDYPSDTINMVVPWAAGGGTDSIARALAAAMEEASGQTVVVNNISGASGATGTVNVIQSDPDGYTVLFNGSSDLTSLLTFQDLPFTIDDLAFVGGVFETPTWIVSHADRGYETLSDLLEAAEATPGEITIGVGGAVGAHALMAHAIKGYSGADIRIVAYQGGAALRKGVLANEVDAGSIHSPILLDAVKDGSVRVLATGMPLSGITEESLRSTPTLQELGIPVEVGVTRGVFVPKGTPETVIDALAGILEQAAKSESFAEFGQDFGFAPVWLDKNAFETLVRSELESFAEIHAAFIAE